MIWFILYFIVAVAATYFFIRTEYELEYRCRKFYACTPRAVISAVFWLIIGPFYIAYLASVYKTCKE